jgi:hypothetical protein
MYENSASHSSINFVTEMFRPSQQPIQQTKQNQTKRTIKIQSQVQETIQFVQFLVLTVSLWWIQNKMNDTLVIG